MIFANPYTDLFKENIFFSGLQDWIDAANENYQPFLEITQSSMQLYSDFWAGSIKSVFIFPWQTPWLKVDAFECTPAWHSFPLELYCSYFEYHPHTSSQSTEKEIDAGTTIEPVEVIAHDAGNADDLKKIAGVGPAIEKKLNALGIQSYQQIADWTDRDIAEIESSAIKFNGRIEREKWVEQARQLLSAQ